jgi:O-antigen ligase
MSGFVYRDWGAAGSPGWFDNSGEFGMAMAVFFALSVYFVIALRPYWSTLKFAVLLLVFPVLAVVSIVASTSRGAVVGLAAAVCWMLLRSRRRVTALASAIVLALAVLALMPAETKEKFGEAGDDRNSVSRLESWTYGIAMANSHPVFGVGHGNFKEYARANFNPVANDAHNIFVEAAAELGYTGLLAFLSLVVCTFVINDRTRRMARSLPDGGRFLVYMAHSLDAALVVFLVSGFFLTVLYYPYFWINLGMTGALHNAALSRRREAQAVDEPRTWIARPAVARSSFAHARRRRGIL